MEWFEGWRSEALYVLAAEEVLNLFITLRERLLITAKEEDERRVFARRLHPEHLPQEHATFNPPFH